MRARIGILCLLVACALPATARGAPIQRAFQAELALFSDFVPAVFLSGGGTAGVDAKAGHLDSLSFPADAFATQVTVTTVGVEVRVDAANGSGVVAAGGGPAGGFGGAIPVLGTLRICLGGPCDGAPLADLSLPLEVLGAGETTATPSGLFRLIGAPWTTGPVTLSGPGFVSYFSGYRSGPGGLASSTARIGGFLSLVTPARVLIPGVGELAFVAVLDVSFVPEPAPLALLWIGSAGLIALGRRRSSA